MSKKILNDVAEFCGFQIDENEEETGPFTSQLLLNINSEISKLVQLGVVDQESFTEEVTSETTWADILSNESILSMAKTYVKIGVRLVFDPPTASALTDAYKNEKDECEWRALVAAEELRRPAEEPADDDEETETP